MQCGYNSPLADKTIPVTSRTTISLERCLLSRSLPRSFPSFPDLYIGSGSGKSWEESAR
ncbi:hypothetical protein PISMIDRAFT_222226 [Pisolithus microcarpus 441]|uniref:Uncharacterized protein n=1 Tax=Pisolithus microcarpus 441 TaxID=765257 RepID=A0A0C9ZC70_9AGAM|nr:hypothetical protein PISMIDRAFT_222226 [Pisolithus microcarpus 441]